MRLSSLLVTSVILSGVSASRSEALAESKDPAFACGGADSARRSHRALYKAKRESLAAFVALTTGMGSFDSRASHQRDTCFAQDDR
jgi:hypothetical protein